MSDKGFESLKVWQKAHALMLDVHKHILPLLPKEEKYGLADQMRRSSKSVGANIAEGYGRFYYMDDEIRRMLNGYIEWLKTQKLGEKEPGANLYLRESVSDYLVEYPQPNE